MTGLWWRIKRSLIALGLEGTIGLALLASSLLAYFFVLIPAESRIGELNRNISSLSASAREPNKRLASAPVTAPAQLAAYYRFFPPETSTPDWLDKVFNAARKQRLELIEGKYRVRHERAGSLIRYQMTLPVKGTYAQVQHFIAAVLSEIPIAALKGVTFERHKIGDAVVEAKIQLTLYLGETR